MLVLTIYKMFTIRNRGAGTFLTIVMRDGVWAFFLVFCGWQSERDHPAALTYRLYSDRVGQRAAAEYAERADEVGRR